MFARLQRLIVYLAVIDFLGTELALVIADYTRRIIPLGAPLGGPLGEPAVAPPQLLNPILYVIVGLVYPLAFQALSVYDLRRDTRPVGDPYNLARALLVGLFVFAGVLYFSYRDLSRLLVLYFFVTQLALLSAARLCIGAGLRLLYQRGRPLSRVLLVGTGEVAARVAQEIKLRLGESVLIIGCVDDQPGSLPDGLSLLGNLGEAPELVRAQLVDEVIVALPASQYLAVETLVYALLTLPVRVRLVPDYLRLVVVQSSVESLGGIPLIGLREPRISGLAWAVKRAFDVLTTAIMVVVGWPVMLLIALAIKLDTPGPVIFKQQRVGENGQQFWMYKFRTMCQDAEARGPQLGFDPQGKPIYKWPHDARVTRVGRWLRRTSLDELPQLFNVIRGDMSLVGPRPEMLFLVERYDSWQRQRLAVPPGITGWWQVSGRSDLPMHLNTQFDLYYIRNYSLWLDVKILVKTVWVVIRGQGAY
jgi:exopolysaccharide biosynthesis polyprenyl glycosylphosphotransferase